MPVRSHELATHAVDGGPSVGQTEPHELNRTVDRTEPNLVGACAQRSRKPETADPASIKVGLWPWRLPWSRVVRVIPGVSGGPEAYDVDEAVWQGTGLPLFPGGNHWGPHDNCAVVVQLRPLPNQSCSRNCHVPLEL